MRIRLNIWNNACNCFLKTFCFSCCLRWEEVWHSSLWTVKTDSLKRNDKKHILFNIVQPNSRSFLRHINVSRLCRTEMKRKKFLRIHFERLCLVVLCAFTVYYTIFDISPISFSPGLSCSKLYKCFTNVQANVLWSEKWKFQAFG